MVYPLAGMSPTVVRCDVVCSMEKTFLCHTEINSPVDCIYHRPSIYQLDPKLAPRSVNMMQYCNKCDNHTSQLKYR